jgi:hypothetical protein
MALTDAGAILIAKHHCNAYCRGDRHAQVVWFHPDLSEEQYASVVTDNFGFAPLALDPAPEAQITHTGIQGWRDGQTFVIPGSQTAGFHPRLMIFPILTIGGAA